MQLKDFDYPIPRDLIAQRPLKSRDQARLMVIDRRRQKISHDIFANLGQYLPPKSSLVLNDTKVIPARLFGRRATGGAVEILLLKKLADGCSYETLLRPLRRLKIGEKISFIELPSIKQNSKSPESIDEANGRFGVGMEKLNNGGSIVAEICEKRCVRFNRKNLSPVLKRLGHMPLPPYIKRPDTSADTRDYQTVYARREGSVAAPTAGLHFTRRQLAQLKRQGYAIRQVTLHVNYATFKAVEEDNITRHKMHTEAYRVTQSTYTAIQKAKGQGEKIVAVGTTSCRVLETLTRTKMLQGETGLFIYPGFDFQMVDCLVTNFHLPRTTLLMLVYAFGGMALMKEAYARAIEEKYRFYSYGDAMIIL